MKHYIRKLCTRCHGQGEIDCRHCGGDGYNTYGGQCAYCVGIGTETCPECDGDGYIEETDECQSQNSPLIDLFADVGV